MKMLKAVDEDVRILVKTGVKMHITKIEKHLYLIDVKAARIKNFIASYILKGRHAAIVETGPASSVSNLLFGLRELNINPEEVTYVAVSHIHLDHGGGVGTLMKYLPKAKLIVHRRGAPHIANPEKLWTQAREALGSVAEMYGKPEPVPEEKIIAATDGMTFDIGNNIRLKVIETLGHASHHLSYYETLSEGIFTGDAAGIYLNKLDVVVPTTPPPFRLDIALESLGKLVNLRPKHLYYSHFGKAHNPIERLQTYAQQLKLWAKIAKQGIENRDNLEVTSKRIFESDAAAQKAAEHIKTHPVLSETVPNQSVQGFMEFVEKFGSIST